MSSRSIQVGLSLGRMRIGLIILSGTLVTGTIGYTLLEGWSIFESFYVTLLIVSTLGFGTLQPQTAGGQVLAVGLIAVGVGTLYYLVGIFAELAIESQLGLRQERRMHQQISRLRNHIIVCGYGRVGQQVVNELQNEGHPFVVVEPQESKVNQLIERGILVFQGDASEDRVLYTVGIERARGLIACSGTDAVNVFVTLSARAINDKLYIAARAIREDDEPKLMRAGANRAITPASLGGRRLVSLVLRPTVVDWLDVLVHTDNLEMWLEEVHIDALPMLQNKTLGEAQLRVQHGITVLAIKRNGTLITLMSPDIRFTSGDVVVALGTRDNFNRLRDLA